MPDLTIRLDRRPRWPCACRREAMRLLLWLQYQARGKRFARRDVNDCGDCMALLQNIPAPWISRVRAKAGAPGWAFVVP